MQTMISPPKAGALNHVQVRAMLQDAEGLAAAMRRHLARRPQSVLSRAKARLFLICAQLFSAEMRRRLR